jgi:hypothetical protein
MGAPAGVPKITKEGTIAVTSGPLNIESLSAGDLEKSWFPETDFDETRNTESQTSENRNTPKKGQGDDQKNRDMNTRIWFPNTGRM